MLFQCLASFENGGPTLKQHWVNVWCMPGLNYTVNHTRLSKILYLQDLLKILYSKPTQEYISMYQCTLWTLIIL